MREKTYFSKLCLIQIAGPGIEPQIIDPLDPETDLEPLKEALFDPDVVKVLHSGYQDLEIFITCTGKSLPQSLTRKSPPVFWVMAIRYPTLICARTSAMWRSARRNNLPIGHSAH